MALFARSVRAEGLAGSGGSWPSRLGLSVPEAVKAKVMGSRNTCRRRHGEEAARRRTVHFAQSSPTLVEEAGDDAQVRAIPLTPRQDSLPRCVGPETLHPKPLIQFHHPKP